MPLSPEAALRKDTTSAQGATLEHRHFAVIAAILRSLPSDGVDDATFDWPTLVNHFTRELAKTNPRFNAARFIAACKESA